MQKSLKQLQEFRYKYGKLGTANKSVFLTKAEAEKALAEKALADISTEKFYVIFPCVIV